MDKAIIYIGIGQSLLGFIFFIKSKSLNIADKIFGAWLLLIFVLLIGNAVMIEYNTKDIWPLSLNIFLTFPPILFLYSKYIIFKYPKFKKFDYIHFLPALTGLLLVLFNFDIQQVNPMQIIEYYDSKHKILQIIFGNIYILSLWAYSILALINVRRYQKQNANYYSYESSRINLRWLFVVIISYFLFYNLIILVSVFYYSGNEISEIEKFRSGVLIVLVNIICIWGFEQKQLSSGIKQENLIEEFKFKQENHEKYLKTVIKNDKAEEYSQRLINYLNNSMAWKDNELSIDKISVNINISKQLISQILNEHLNKNFYTLINEYRVKYAMELIMSKKCENWSLLAIAHESGFNSKSAFNNFFKKYTGLTPSEYKRRLLIK